MVGVLAVATVLRPSVVAVGPVLPGLRVDLSLGAGAAAVLTALPVVCFGLAAFAGPAVARRLGLDGALTAAVVLVAVGGLARVLAGPALLFAGTAVVAAAIAVANVLLPALVKRDFPHRVGVVTSLYTSSLSAAATLAALSAVPLARSTGAGWRGSLAAWALAAAVAALLWVARSRMTRPHRARQELGSGDGDAVEVAAAGPAPSTGSPRRRPDRLAPRATRRRVVVALTFFMGLQSTGYYTIVAWLPTLLQDSGVSPSRAGALLSLAVVLGIPAALVVPALAARMAQQRGLAVVTALMTAAGWAGLLLAPVTAPVLWVVLLGVGTGSTFPLALVLVTLRSSTAEATRRTSATVQGLGYLIAAAGPLLVGLLHEASGSWHVPLLLLLVATAGQAVSGWGAGRATAV